MFRTILILGLLNLTKITISLNFCEPDNTGLNQCHDGGCNNNNAYDTENVCLCSFSQTVMTGQYCGLYEDKCTLNPCVNNGKCKSGIGHHVCECSNEFHGVNCEIPITIGDTIRKIKRLSLFYRIKSKHGEELHLLLISDNFGDENYNVIIKGVLSSFRYKLSDFKKKINISDAIQLCSKKLDSGEFKVNSCNGPDNYYCQNMCNFIPKLYGTNNEVEIALIGPYFNTRSSLRREEIYYDLYKTNRMGSKHTLEVQLYTKNEDSIEYKINFIQFIAYDIMSLCLPVLEYFSYNQQDTEIIKELKERRIEKVFRSVPLTLKINFVLKRHCPYELEEIHYVYLWKMLNYDQIIDSYLYEKGLPYLNNLNTSTNDLMIDSYILPMGIYVFVFQVVITNRLTGVRTSDFYLRYLDIQLQDLVAIISGPSPLYLGKKLLILDASESYNPNEKDGQKYLLYTWECNVPTDDICKISTSTNPKLNLNKRFSEVGEYTFTLTVSINNNYISTIGKPKDGIKTIVVYHDPPETTTQSTTTPTTTPTTQSTTTPTTTPTTQSTTTPTTQSTTKSTTQSTTTSTTQSTTTPTTQSTTKSTTQSTTTSTTQSTTQSTTTPTTQSTTKSTTQSTTTPTTQSTTTPTTTPTTQSTIKSTTQSTTTPTTQSTTKSITQSTTKPTTQSTTKSTISTSTEPQEREKKISIKCIQNCMPLSNPSNDLYLEATINFIGHKFEWYYQLNGINIKPVDDIALTDVPKQMLIVKRNKLEYGTMYNFIVKYPKYTLKNNLSITTVSRPKIGNCMIQPLFGLAGETLFSISCIHFSNETTFEYYQKNKNTEASLGVLLDRRNITLKNFKLTSSNELIVRVINIHNGAYSQTHLTARVSECNTHLLKELYKELNMHLKNKDTSKAVSIISILSDVLRDNHIKQFKKLFKALNKIPLLNCISKNIFCIDQFVLILQKVIEDYYFANKGTITVDGLLRIAKQLLKISIALLEYMESSNEYNIMIEINKIEEIKRKIRENLIFIVNNIKYNDENTDGSERYLWSSFENVLLPGWFRNRSSQLESKSFLYDTIGKSLANELLLKGDNVGIINYRVEKNLMKTFDEIEGVEVIMPIVSLNLLNFDKSNSKNVTTYKHFNNYIDLNFGKNETKKKQKRNYSVQVLAQNSNSIKFDKNILVFRIDMKNISELFVTLSDSTYDLRFAWLRNTRPDIKVMKSSKYAINLKAGENNEFTLKTQSQHRDEIHYIGVSAFTKEKLMRGKYANFSLIIYGPQCLYWSGVKWAPSGIIVGSNTTENNIHCRSKHTTLFSGIFYTLPDVIDTVTSVNHTDAIINNMVCLITVLVVFLIYTTLLIWSKYQDKKDVSRGEIVILHDNYPGEDEVYLVTVYTGDIAGAGTSANVCLQLHGNISSSRVHWLYNSQCDVLQRFNDDWFIVFTPTSLGEFKSIHIWHDNYGNNPNWYCKRIEVTDVRKQKKWNFNVERWFTTISSSEDIEHVIIVGAPYDWQKKPIDDVGLTIREEYLWASVFIRHPRSLVTRCQKLSKIICLLLSAMVTSLLFYDFVDNDEEKFLKFKITYSQIYISIQGCLISLFMTLSTSYCFSKSSAYKKYYVVQEEKKNDKIKESWSKRILALIAPHKTVYFPARMEGKSNKKTVINYWLIAGWALSILIYCLSIVLIIAFGLKIGQVKSLHWLMTLLITILQNAFVFEPMQILIFSLIIFKLDQGQHHMLLSKYTIKLENFRRNTKNQLQNIRLIQSLRERRNRYVYSPMTPTSAQILQARYRDKVRLERFQENVATCLLLILISLCCISGLYSFSNHKHIVHGNNINKLFLKSLLQTNMMDLEMIKAFLTETLLNPFHIREYYSGMPIVNKSMPYLSENNARGWCSFYNSKLVNGGIRLKQNRITEKNLKWESDTGSYKEKWIKTTEIKNVTAWVYRSIPVIKYFGLWFPVTENSGFVLDLTGQLSEYEKNIKDHLENGWLDNRTRNLVIEFHTYTPNINCITVFKIKFQTSAGLLYTVHSEVWSVPSGSVVVTWNTYVFTLAFMFAYAMMAVRLILSLKHMVSTMYAHGGGEYRALCAAYECAVLAVVMCAMFAVTGRWQLMEVAHELYTEAQETAVVGSMTYMCQAYEHVASLASVIVAMALFRTFQLVMYERRASHVVRALGASMKPTAAVAAYSLIVTYGAWGGLAAGDGPGFLNAFVLSRTDWRNNVAQPPAVATVVSAVAFLLLNAAVVSIITKRYILSKLYTRQ